MKTLIVATEIQKTVFEKVILNEFSNGFWRTARPANHAEQWKNVTVQVGLNLGPQGFQLSRKYNFANPEFVKKSEKALLQAARSVNPDITIKQLKKQLATLGLIVGSRLSEIGGAITKLNYKKSSVPRALSIAKKPIVTVKKAAAIFADNIEA